MQRVSHITQATDLFGSGKHGYQSGEVATQRPGTVVTPGAMNALQEEIANVVEANGFVLNASLFTQLLLSIRIMLASFGIQNHVPRTAAAAYSGNFYDAVYGDTDDLHVIVGDSSGAIQTSPDGVTWTARTAGSSYAGAFYAATYGGGVFVISGSTGEIQSSADGVTWTRRTPGAASNADYHGAGYGNGLFVLGGSSGHIQTSPDGTTWTFRSKAGAFGGSFNGHAYGAGLHCIVGDSSEIQTSPDGTTWTKRTQGGGSTALLNSIAFGNGKFVAVGSSVAQVSSDGVTWTLVTLTGKILHSVRFWSDIGVFVASGTNGTVMMSVDGLTWRDLTNSEPAASTLRGLAIGKKSAILAGTNGVIRQTLIPLTV